MSDHVLHIVVTSAPRQVRGIVIQPVTIKVADFLARLVLRQECECNEPVDIARHCPAIGATKMNDPIADASKRPMDGTKCRLPVHEDRSEDVAVVGDEVVGEADRRQDGFLISEVAYSRGGV